MAVSIQMPGKKDDTSMGRRLFAMAAPLVGGAFGGPMGAAAGGMIGNKVAGGDQPAAAGAQGMLGGLMGGGKAPAPTPQPLETGGNPAPIPASDNSFSRRMSALSQSPQVAAQEGLSVLNELPPDHPIRQQYTAPLVKLQMLSQRRT